MEAAENRCEVRSREKTWRRLGDVRYDILRITMIPYSIPIPLISSSGKLSEWNQSRLFESRFSICCAIDSAKTREFAYGFLTKRNTWTSPLICMIVTCFLRCSNIKAPLLVRWHRSVSLVQGHCRPGREENRASAYTVVARRIQPTVEGYPLCYSLPQARKHLCIPASRLNALRLCWSGLSSARCSHDVTT